MVSVAVAPVFAAVAVNNELLVVLTVGVPVMFAPLILNPVGNVFAVYVILRPAPLVALNVTLLIALFTALVYVVLFVGLFHVTMSGLIVILNVLAVV